MQQSLVFAYGYPSALLWFSRRKSLFFPSYLLSNNDSNTEQVVLAWISGRLLDRLFSGLCTSSSSEALYEYFMPKYLSAQVLIERENNHLLCYLSTL